MSTTRQKLRECFDCGETWEFTGTTGKTSIVQCPFCDGFNVKTYGWE